MVVRVWDAKRQKSKSREIDGPGRGVGAETGRSKGGEEERRWRACEGTMLLGSGV